MTGKGIAVCGLTAGLIYTIHEHMGGDLIFALGFALTFVIISLITDQGH
jgi:hypothetical protein